VTCTETRGTPHDRVDHLLVEARIAFAGRQAVRDQDERVVEVDGTIVDVARHVVVHDGDLVAGAALIDRSPRQRPIADRELHLVAQKLPPTWVERIDAQGSAHGR